MARKKKTMSIKRFVSTDELYDKRQDAVEEVLAYLEQQLAQNTQSNPELHQRVQQLYPRVRFMLFHSPALLNAVRVALDTFDLPAAQLFALDYKRYFRRIAQAAEHKSYIKTRKRGKPKPGEGPIIY